MNILNHTQTSSRSCAATLEWRDFAKQILFMAGVLALALIIIAGPV